MLHTSGPDRPPQNYIGPRPPERKGKRRENASKRTRPMGKGSAMKAHHNWSKKLYLHHFPKSKCLDQNSFPLGLIIIYEASKHFRRITYCLFFLAKPFMFCKLNFIGEIILHILILDNILFSYSTYI